MRYARGDVLGVRWPDLPSGTVAHVAVVGLDDSEDELVCAVGTSHMDRHRPSVALDWRRMPAYRWVRGWPQGSGPTYFYGYNIQAVPRDRVDRATPHSTGKIGALPQAVVAEIVALY